eukprot:14155526-Ditylum_brightwellii.AAC.1
MQSNTIPQASQQHTSQEEEMEGVIGTQPEENTDTITAQSLTDFTNFAFGAAVMPTNPTATVVPTTPPPARTLLNDYPCLDNTSVKDRTTPSQYTEYTKQAFHLYYNKEVEPLCLAFLNMGVYV